MEVMSSRIVLVVLLVAFKGLFVASSSTITTKEGQNVTLPCNTLIKGGMWYQTFWFNGTKKIFSVSQSSHSKYTERPISVVGRHSINLNRVNRYDHGNYSCRALFIVGGRPVHDTENVLLYVKARPIITSTTPPMLNLTQSTQSRDLLLDCTVSAFSKAKVTWKKVNGQLPKDRISWETNGTLLIKKASSEDTGTYICIASNELGTDRTSFTVTVFEPPRIFSKRKFHANVGEEASVICESRGNPEPQFTWSWKDANNDTLSIGRGEEISGHSVTTVQGNVTSRSTLEIKDVTTESWTTYTCEVVNTLGRDTAEITLTGNTRPDSPTIVDVETSVSNAVVRWKFGDDGGLQLNALKLQYKEGSESRWQEIQIKPPNRVKYTIMDLKSNTNYKFRILATNNLGTSPPSTTYLAKTGKAAPPESPTIIDVEASVSNAIVRWKFGDNGGLELIALKLQYKEESESRWQEIQIKPPNRVKYTIMDLKSNTDYKFRILATNSLGTSPPSSTYLAKTGKAESHTSAQSSKGFMGLSRDMTLLIAGVGGAFFVILIAIICVFCFVRKIHKNSTPPANTPVNSRPTSQQEQAEMTSLLNDHHHIPNIPLPQQPDMPQGAEAISLSNSPWEFPRNRVDLQVVLGSGAFGLVMKGQAQGIKGCVGKMYVAVKIVKECDSETARRDLIAELELLKLIDPHPNVIGLLGCCTRQEPLMVIVEFCAFGDLQSYLRHCRGVEDKYYQDLYKVPIEKLGSRDLLSFAIQTARGMAHLSGMKVVHRDLAARNVLIDENKVCKVADFGFARDIYVEDHYTRKTQGGRFPIKWMAIESLLDGVSTSKSDVWSFGVVLWEIVTLGASPYPGMNSQEVINFLQDCYRMDKPKHCSEELYVLMLDCWQVAPQRRPTFTELSQHLTKLFSDEREYIDMRMYEDHLYINFDNTSGTMPSRSSKSGSVSHHESAM